MKVCLLSKGGGESGDGRHTLIFGFFTEDFPVPPCIEINTFQIFTRLTCLKFLSYLLLFFLRNFLLSFGFKLLQPCSTIPSDIIFFVAEEEQDNCSATFSTPGQSKVSFTQVLCGCFQSSVLSNQFSGSLPEECCEVILLDFTGLQIYILCMEERL